MGRQAEMGKQLQNQYHHHQHRNKGGSSVAGAHLARSAVDAGCCVVTGAEVSVKSDMCPWTGVKAGDEWDMSQEAGYSSLTFQQITQMAGAKPLLVAMKDTSQTCDHSTLHPASPRRLCIGHLKGHRSLPQRPGELHPSCGIDCNTGISDCSLGACMTDDTSPAFMCPEGGRQQPRDVWDADGANHTMPFCRDVICKSGGRAKAQTDDAEGSLVRDDVTLRHNKKHVLTTKISTTKKRRPGLGLEPSCSRGLEYSKTNDCVVPAGADVRLDCSNHRNVSMSRLSRCDKSCSPAPPSISSQSISSNSISSSSSISSKRGRTSVPWRCAITGLPITVVQMLRLLVLLMTVHTGSLAVQAQDLGPRYKTSRRICLSDIECNKFNKTMGEVCWWAWDGCNTGECTCDPRNSFYDTEADMCRPVKYGDEKCEEGDRCWEGMICQEGHCRCQKGRMTSDKMFCLDQNERLLGQQCSFSSDICYQRADHGYTNKEVSCSYDERCRCNEGYKEDGPACRKWNVNEAGCDEDHHCQGGALCVDNICQCPSRYLPVARDSKCAKIGAKYDLQIGEMCDEINEERYCAFGLVCHQCAGDTHYSCVKFVEAEALPYQLSSASQPTSPSHQVVLAIIISAIVYGLR